MAKQRILRVFEVYKSNRNQQWSWRARSYKTGKIVFTGESYPSEAHAISAIKRELEALGAISSVRIDVLSGDFQRATEFDPVVPWSGQRPVTSDTAKPKKVYPKLQLADMEFDPRTLALLKKQGLRNAEQLVRYSRAEILKIPGMVGREFKDLVKVLRKHTLSLPIYPPKVPGRRIVLEQEPVRGDLVPRQAVCSCGNLRGNVRIGEICELCKTDVEAYSAPTTTDANPFRHVDAGRHSSQEAY